RTGLLLPSLDIHSLRQEPHGQCSFSDEAGEQDVRRQTGRERRGQKGQPTQTGKGHQGTENARQEGRTENKVADQQAIEAEKYQRVDGRGEMKERANRSNGASRKAEQSSK